MLKRLSIPISLLLLAATPMQVAANDNAGRSYEAHPLFQDNGLATPNFTSRAFPIFEKEIILSYSNPNEDSETEIFISRSADSGFELSQVAPAGEEVYYDTSRLPRTTYYFRLRAKRGDLRSDFSEVTSFTTGSKFYAPTLTAEAKDASTIELKLYDRSYNDLYYVLWRDGPGPDFNPTITATDSGQVFIIKDEFLEAGYDYVYRVDAYTKGPNMPRYLGIATATATTSQGPSIYAFTIVDADTDQEVTDLYDGIEVIVPNHPNLIAQVTPETESVEFYLNGRKRIENSPPYAFFYDARGDYKPGRLDAGTYELVATPYTRDNAQGIKGASLKITFTVTIPTDRLAIRSFVLVDPNTGADIRELKWDDVVDISMHPNIRVNTYEGGNVESVVMELNGARRTENEPPYAYFTDVDGVYRPGRLRDEWDYTLTATGYSGNNGTGVKGATQTIRFRTGLTGKIMNFGAEPDATSAILSWTPVAGAWAYRVLRLSPDGAVATQTTLGKHGYFTSTGLPSSTTFSYVVEAIDINQKVLGRSDTLPVTTTARTSIRTQYNLLAIVFNPADVMTPYMEGIRTFLKYRIDFLKHASHYSVNLDLYTGDLVIINAYPPLLPGSTAVNYRELVKTAYPELNNNNIIDLIESYDIDIVWQLGGPPGYDFGENALFGNEPLGTNTWIPYYVPCSRKFFVHSNSADARAFDAAVHHVEGTMTSATEKSPETWPRDKIYQVYTKDRSSWAVYPEALNLFERFRLTDEWTGVGAYASKGNANCGSSHYLPGSIRDSENFPDYTYADPAAWQRYVDCYADDWLNYPNFSGTPRKINGYDFGAFNYYQQGTTTGPFAFAGSSFHYWWFNHIPHNPGVTDQKLNNWWPYVYDVNRFDGSAIDYAVDGFPEIPKTYNTPDNEFGTDEPHPLSWQFWHSNTNYGLRADLTSIAASQEPDNVKTGQFAIKAIVDVREFSTDGRNDLIFPTFKNAHWNFLNADSITFSVKFQGRDDAARYTHNTNPIIRLCQNGNNRIEFVPQENGLYANLFKSDAWLGDDQWFTFSIPIAGNASWKRNVIGYIEPDITPEQNEAATRELIQKILADVNYFEVSILIDAPLGTDLTYYLDNVTVHFQDTEQYAAESAKMSVSVFPVPTLNELNVNITGSAEKQVRLVIKDNQGNPVYTSVKSVGEWNDVPVITSNLPPGIYFAHFSGAGNEVFVMKILKD